MSGSTRAVRVFARPEPADLRRGYDGLYGMVRNGLGLDPQSGHLCLFIDRRMTSAKVLVHDGTGLCIHSKRLDRKRFACRGKDGRTSPCD